MYSIFNYLPLPDWSRINHGTTVHTVQTVVEDHCEDCMQASSMDTHSEYVPLDGLNSISPPRTRGFTYCTATRPGRQVGNRDTNGPPLRPVQFLHAEQSIRRRDPEHPDPKHRFTSENTGMKLVFDSTPHGNVIFIYKRLQDAKAHDVGVGS